MKTKHLVRKLNRPVSTNKVESTKKNEQEFIYPNLFLKKAVTVLEGGKYISESRLIDFFTDEFIKKGFEVFEFSKGYPLHVLDEYRLKAIHLDEKIDNHVFILNPMHELAQKRKEIESLLSFLNDMTKLGATFIVVVDRAKYSNIHSMKPWKVDKIFDAIYDAENIYLNVYRIAKEYVGVMDFIQIHNTKNVEGIKKFYYQHNSRTGEKGIHRWHPENS